MKQGVLILSASFVFLLAVGTAVAQPRVHGLTEPAGPMTEDEFSLVAVMSGIRFQRYVYDIPFNHCIHFKIESQSNDKNPEYLPFGTLCDRPGRHGLVIAWKRVGDGVSFWTQIHQLDGPFRVASGSRVLQIPTQAGWDGYEIENPTLNEDEPSVLVDIGYYNSSASSEVSREYLRIKVLGQLQRRDGKAVEVGTGPTQ